MDLIFYLYMQTVLYYLCLFVSYSVVCVIAE